MKYLHTGIPSPTKLEGMTYAEPMKLWLKAEPTYGIEHLYFEPDSPMPGMIQTRGHVAFQVEDIDAALEGKSIVFPKYDLGAAFIAFVWDKDCLVEFYQYK